jgi:hypothetical protein
VGVFSLAFPLVLKIAGAPPEGHAEEPIVGLSVLSTAHYPLTTDFSKTRPLARKRCTDAGGH